MLLYGTVHFNGRKALDISVAEYLYLFCVMSLERDRDGGFCASSDTEMSGYIGIARKNIIEMKKRLSAKGLLARGDGGVVRVTDKFKDVCNAEQQSVSAYFSNEQKAPSEGRKQKPKNGKPVTKRDTPCNETLHPDPVTNRYTPCYETLQDCNETLHPVLYVPIDGEYTFLQYSTQTEKNEKNENKNEAGNEGKKANTLVSRFRESIYFKGGAGREKFEADLKAAGCPGEVDFDYYFNRILTWSDKNGAKSKDWGKTALKFVQDDAKQGHMATVQFIPIDQQPQQAQPQHATHSRRNGSSRKNAISHAQVLADVERIIADGW